MGVKNRRAFAFLALLATHVVLGLAVSAAAQTPAPSTTFPLEDQLAEPEADVQSRQKDGWDKLSAVSGLISGGLVATIGIAATVVYNRRQLAVQAAHHERDQDVQAVDVATNLIPHLGSDDPRKVEAALVLLTELGSPDLARQLSLLYKSDGGLAALQRLSEGPNPSPATVATLNGLLSQLTAGVLWIVTREGKRRGSGFVAGPNLVVAPDYVVEDGHHDIAISTQSGELRAAAVVKVAYGLALLEADTEGVPELPIHPSGPLSFGAELRVLVRPPGGKGLDFSSLERGTLIGIADQVHNAANQTLRLLVAELAVFPGAAGAPVLDRDGGVIGIVSAIDKNLGRAFLTPSETLVGLVDELSASRIPDLGHGELH